MAQGRETPNHGDKFADDICDSGMQNGGTIYADHDGESRPVDPTADGDQKVDLLGCWEGFLKVHVGKGTGWTREACTNMNTTCD